LALRFGASRKSLRVYNTINTPSSYDHTVILPLLSSRFPLLHRLHSGQMRPQSVEGRGRRRPPGSPLQVIPPKRRCSITGRRGDAYSRSRRGRHLVTTAGSTRNQCRFSGVRQNKRICGARKTSAQATFARRKAPPRAMTPAPIPTKPLRRFLPPNIQAYLDRSGWRAQRQKVPSQCEMGRDLPLTPFHVWRQRWDLTAPPHAPT